MLSKIDAPFMVPLGGVRLNVTRYSSVNCIQNFMSVNFTILVCVWFGWAEVDPGSVARLFLKHETYLLNWVYGAK
jgi:hypothetical protein